VCRMEATGSEPAGGHARNVAEGLLVLERHGVKVLEDGVRLIDRKRV
jgi:hypothetical protein